MTHPSLQFLPPLLEPGLPATALAPMQDVTTLPFMRAVAKRGAPDWFFTEYFRVHETSRLEPHILSSVTENDTGRPVFAQMIGESLTDLARTVRELSKHPVAGIDLNLGCPAPKVYRKNVGGGLLRDPAKVDEILAMLRAECPGRFTVKMRIGFETTDFFDTLLDSVNRHKVDLLSVHGRTVKEMYRAEVHYDFIAHAVQRANCPVLANGNVTSGAKARKVLAETGAAGVMVGRSAIRNPWIFRQIREACGGRTIFQPTLGDLREYVDDLRTSDRRAGNSRPDSGQPVEKVFELCRTIRGPRRQIPLRHAARGRPGRPDESVRPLIWRSTTAMRPGPFSRGAAPRPRRPPEPRRSD